MVTDYDRPVSSLTDDLVVAGVAGSILIIVEAHRLGKRGGWTPRHAPAPADRDPVRKEVVFAPVF
ncbi:MAG: hypothetical protein ABI238_00955 [Terrimesophilobacter sp.]